MKLGTEPGGYRAGLAPVEITRGGRIVDEPVDATGMAEIKVMIVDDSPMMRMTLSSIVSKVAGARVVASCENGQVALQTLATAQPNLILSDIEMPVMDGLTFLRMARARTQVPIIILSSVANAGNANVDKARALGATAVLAKPSGSTSYDLEERLGMHIQRMIKGLAR